MKFLPISINIQNKKILIIGGGRIASHKIGFLSPFTNNITVVALEISSEIKSLNYSYKEKAYEKADLQGFLLIYACTNNKELNRQIKQDAEELGILCNVVDDPQLCDFVSPAIYKKDNYTIAVGSNGENVHKSIQIRNIIKNYLENDKDVFN